MEDRFQRAAKAYIRKAMSEKDMSATELARVANVSQSTITRPLNDTNGTHTFSLKTIQKVYQATGIEPPPLITSIDKGEQDKSSVQPTDRGLPVKDLPIRGQAFGNNGKLMFTDDLSNAYTERPWFLLGRPEAYACYVYGDSMIPAFRPGNLAYVDPSRPANIGDDVVVILKTGEAMVKHLVRRSGGNALLLQHNPEKEIEIPLDEIERIDRIISVVKISV